MYVQFVFFHTYSSRMLKIFGCVWIKCVFQTRKMVQMQFVMQKEACDSEFQIPYLTHFSNLHLPHPPKTSLATPFTTIIYTYAPPHLNQPVSIQNLPHLFPRSQPSTLSYPPTNLHLSITSTSPLLQLNGLQCVVLPHYLCYWLHGFHIP